MNLSVRGLFLVLWPLVGTPHGVTGCRPPEVRPSPPPCGWSTGFMTTPRTTGRRPFRGDSPLEIQAAIAKGEIRLDEVSPEAKDLEKVLRKCLALEPEDRPASAEQLRKELIPALRRLSASGDP